MPIAVEFFVAPDDGVASEMGPQHRHDGLPAFACADFYPDDAAGDWEVLLVGGAATEPRVVVPMKNDGFTVFELPERLCSTLSQVSRSRLVEAAGAWVGLVKDDGVPVEAAVEALRTDGFEGPRWDLTIGWMHEKCRPTVEKWIVNGTMARKAKEKRRAVSVLSPALREVLRNDATARHDLVLDALLAGARALRSVLRNGEWDPHQTSLQTTFINMVILQFSTVARTWANSQRYRAYEDAREELPDLPASPAFDQLAAAEDWIDFNARYKDEKNPMLRAMIRMRAMDMGPKEIATELGISDRAAEGMWRRFKTKTRDQGSDGRPA
ncbi:hypothetical protein EF903_11545 [Streptomyces sp. WAC05292]|uniref:hypothetical protein n=1 Tax=Streptomyces sp. WAC05292 TaxID=2487418 RepID=UPI000F742618|nr:hypothetical protein [Streptomyces sp. WAC05292]RSS91117.1 hypothetical protein EF903_11545 [Streptomyces sp. WAC05292]